MRYHLVEYPIGKNITLLPSLHSVYYYYYYYICSILLKVYIFVFHWIEMLAGQTVNATLKAWISQTVGRVWCSG